MIDKYNNKYRIASSRASWWNYGQNAAYFVTTCTKKRKHFFGEIVPIQPDIDAPRNVETQCIASLQDIKLEMRLSKIGEIVEREWLETPAKRPDMNLELREFSVMPNHFHGIIVIGINQYNNEQGILDKIGANNKIIDNKNDFGPQSKNLASIIRGFKTAVTTNARLVQSNFAWQPRFHDHIIRNEAEYQRVANYIINNPANWNGDKLYSRSL